MSQTGLVYNAIWLGVLGGGGTAVPPSPTAPPPLFLYAATELQQYATKKGWQMQADGSIFVAHQDDIVKSKNIVESIQFESLSSLMAASQTV